MLMYYPHVMEYVHAQFYVTYVHIYVCTHI